MARVAARPEIILLVEDEVAVRRSVSNILTQANYSVVGAACTDEALTEFARRGGDIDLLLTDVTMPGASGKELAHDLREMRPDLKIVFMTGYTDEVIEDRGFQDDADVCVHKPFKPDKLLATLSEVLGTAKTSAP